MVTFGTMKACILLASIAIAGPMPAHACDIVRMFSGQTRFDAVRTAPMPRPYTRAESALIRRGWDRPLGEVAGDRAGWTVVDYDKGRIGTITPKLTVVYADDG